MSLTTTTTTITYNPEMAKKAPAGLVYKHTITTTNAATKKITITHAHHAARPATLVAGPAAFNAMGDHLVAERRRRLLAAGKKVPCHRCQKPSRTTNTSLAEVKRAAWWAARRGVV